MSIIFMDGFDHYPLGSAGGKEMFEGAWSYNKGLTPTIVDDIVRTGKYSVRQNSNLLSREFGYALPQAQSSLYVYAGYYTPSYPSGDAIPIIILRDEPKNSRLLVEIMRDGSLKVTGASSFRTNPTIVKAGTWHTVELHYVSGAACTLYVDGEQAASGDPGSSFDVAFFGIDSSGDTDFYMDDVIIRTGDEAKPLKETGVHTLDMVADGPISSWSPSYLTHEGTGAAWTSGDGGIELRKSESVDFNAEDWTIETWFKFLTQPKASERFQIMSKWGDNLSSQAWQLYLGGSAIYDGSLTFEYFPRGSTDKQVLSSSQREFVPSQWYHVAVSRVGTHIFLFIDGLIEAFAKISTGISLGSNKTIYIGLNKQSGFREKNPSGYFDETRITLGKARYDVPFTPTDVLLPRNAADPLWDKTICLLGYDGSITNEAGDTYTPSFLIDKVEVISGESPSSIAGKRYLTQQDGYSSSYVENVPTPAHASFTLVSATPANDTWGTVTLAYAGDADRRTYTFVSNSPTANQVLIGANASDTLKNLVRAINGGVGDGDFYGSGTAPNTHLRARFVSGTTLDSVRIEARIPGISGNASTLATTGTALSIPTDGAFLPGMDQPLTTQFVAGKLPASITTIHGVVPIVYSLKEGSAFVKAKPDIIINKKTLTSASSQLSTNYTWHYRVFSSHTDNSPFNAQEISGCVLSVVQDPVSTA